MYNLNFMEQIESGMDSLMRQKDLYMQIKTKILDLQKEGNAIADEGEKLTDENSKEYLELVEKANQIKEGINNLGKDLKAVRKRFENIKKYIIENLIENKNILEKYKNVKDDEELNKLREGLENTDINKENLDKKINELREDINLNNLSKEEINKLNKEDRKKVLNAKEQYLNNKKALEKNEKIKYIVLLGDEEPKKRLFQCESAIAYINKEFNIENIEEVLGKLEETLDIQKQMPQIKFDLKTHTYTYINERGKETEFEMFEKEDDKKYTTSVPKEYIESVQQWAKGNGLSKRQMKAIDYNVVKILQTKNPDLLNNYLEAIKEEEEPNFSIEYNFKTKGMDKEDKIDKKTLKAIKKSAKKQEKKGIATVIKNKIKGKVIGVLAALGLAGGAATAAIAAQGIDLDKGPITGEVIGESLGKDKVNDVKDKLKEKNNKKEENKNKENIDNKKEEKQATVGDYIKISEGAMLFNNPIDELRIMNGMNATEKIQIKQSSKDKLYKINKEGYYSLDGNCIEIGVGESLEEALKNKGLEKSFIEEGNSIKMYHVVADGVSQWVKAEDIEKVEIRTDKFGNPIDKTEEEKMVDEAMENYNRQKSATKQQETRSNQSVGNGQRTQNVNTGNNEGTQNVSDNKEVIIEEISNGDKSKHLESDEVSPKRPHTVITPDDGVSHKKSKDDILNKRNKDKTENNVIADDEPEVVIQDRYDDSSVISKKEFRKQYRDSVENARKNKNIVIDVDAEIIDDVEEQFDENIEYQNSVEEAEERLEMIMEEMEELAKQSKERHEMMMEALEEQIEVEEELGMQEMAEDEEER